MRKVFIGLLIGHLVLLALASTNFSILSWMWGPASLNWNYFQFTHKDGWGYIYVSDYSAGQVLCYILGYGLGVAAFAAAMAAWRFFAAVLGVLVCLAGAASFAIEATHWLWDHHLSLIASAPAAVAVLWIYIAIRLALRRRKADLPLAAESEFHANS